MRQTVFFLWLFVSVGADAAPIDADGDGIDDALEEALIARFRPSLLVSAGDCAGLPAAFQAFSRKPRVVARDGTVYASATPVPAPGMGFGAALEIHYYHLWESDCGHVSPHSLDVEHLSALAVADSLDANADAWRVEYWYAGAHENTVCDTSNGARAELLDAVDRGPTVWISEGKHASYLSRELCNQRGCGGDGCDQMMPLPQHPVVNIGELSAPLAGATWIGSDDWPLADKLAPDFHPQLISRLDANERQVLARANGDWRVTQYSISVGGEAILALGAAGEHGGGSLVEADEQTRHAVHVGLGRAGRALGSAVRALGLTKHDDPVR